MTTERIDGDAAGADEDFGSSGKTLSEVLTGDIGDGEGWEDFDAQAIWNETVSALSGDETPRDTPVGSESEEEESEEPSKEEGEEEESEEEAPSEKEDETSAGEESAAELKARLAALEAKLEARNAQEEAGEEEDPELEFTDQEKELIEFSEGLDTMMAKVAKKAAKEALSKYISDQEATVSKETEAEQETKFWGELDSWFKEESPDLELNQIRQSPDFNDWLANHKTWVDSQLASAKGRQDTSGAKEVFRRYIRESSPGEAHGKRETTGSKRRMAAARTPSSLTAKRTMQRQQEGTSEDDIWKQESKKLTQSSGATVRYL